VIDEKALGTNDLGVQRFEQPRRSVSRRGKTRRRHAALQACPVDLEKSPDQNARAMATTLNNLGALAAAQGKNVEAEKYLTRALDIGTQPCGRSPEPGQRPGAHSAPCRLLCARTRRLKPRTTPRP